MHGYLETPMEKWTSTMNNCLLWYYMTEVKGDGAKRRPFVAGQQDGSAVTHVACWTDWEHKTPAQVLQKQMFTTQNCANFPSSHCVRGLITSGMRSEYSKQ